MKTCTQTTGRPCGFTLVELVVVLVILGILANVATPKLLEVSTTAKENGLRQSLVVVRDAIQLYAATHGGALPGADGKEATFLADLDGFIRGDFPKNPITSNPVQSDKVKVVKKGDPLAGTSSGAAGWLYDCVSGEFIANSDALLQDGTTAFSEL